MSSEWEYMHLDPVIEECNELKAENAALRRERDVLREYVQEMTKSLAGAGAWAREALAEADKAREGG